MNLRTCRTHREVILLVARHTGYVESLHVIVALLTVTIYHVVCSAEVVLLPYLHVDDVLAYEYLIRNTDDLILTVLVEDDDVINV